MTYLAAILLLVVFSFLVGYWLGYRRARNRAADEIGAALIRVSNS